MSKDLRNSVRDSVGLNLRSKRPVLSGSECTSPKSSKKRKSTNSSKSKEVSEVLKCHNNKKLKPACNIVKYIKDHEMSFAYPKVKNPFKDLIIKYCSTFKISKIESPFDRRVTFMIWHPTNPKLLAVASHWGDVILYDHEKDVNSAPLIPGVGAGGSIQGMKFDPINPSQIYAASMEGKFMSMNFDTKQTKSFLQTNDINRWYISVDINLANNILVAGDTKGNLSILTNQGQVIADKIQLHKKTSKISHAEFSKREPWLLCTSSTDSTTKLWDIRSLRSEKSEMVKPLQVIKHEKPINAAYFSLKDGCRLLTTDQFDKIYIYRAPLWNLETCIQHPHRQFQHLTPIKASWHPLEDIVFVGRYPHVNFPGYHSGELRTIDFFDADDGKLLYQHYQTGCNGILSLNKFNITGEVLASSYGARFVLWKPNLRALQELTSENDYEPKRKSQGMNDSDSEDKDWSTFLKKQTKEKIASRKQYKIQVILLNDKNSDKEI